MIYILKVRKPWAIEDELVEITAPDFYIATIIVAINDPGTHIVEYVGSYVEGSKGEA